MGDKNAYQEEMKIKYILKIREILKELPEFCENVFMGTETKTAERTRFGYAHDVRGFFRFLVSEIEEFKHISNMRDFGINDLEQVTAIHIDKFLSHTSYYFNGKKELTNGNEGKARKLAAIRKMYKYLCKNKLLLNNPSVIVDTPSIDDKTIIKLDPNEVVELLEVVETGETLTPKQQKYHPLLFKRDLAILYLLLGTGLRVSECVGIDINHINFSTNEIKVIRKGGNEADVAFSNEVAKVLKDYIAQRQYINIKESDENALFISLHRKRISVGMIERILKNYTENMALTKNISPHKLRSTFGTNLYRETGDIYLVADALGHKDVNTTRKHYAASDKDRVARAIRDMKIKEI